MQNRKNKKGFTLVELIVVIAIIGILAAVLIPTFSGAIDSANRGAVESTAGSLKTAYIALVADPNVEDDDIDQAKMAEYAGITLAASQTITVTADGFTYQDTSKGYKATYTASNGQIAIAPIEESAEESSGAE